MTDQSNLDRRAALGVMAAVPLIVATSPGGAADTLRRDSQTPPSGTNRRAIVDIPRFTDICYAAAPPGGENTGRNGARQGRARHRRYERAAG